MDLISKFLWNLVKLFFNSNFKDINHLIFNIFFFPLLQNLQNNKYAHHFVKGFSATSKHGAIKSGARGLTIWEGYKPFTSKTNTYLKGAFTPNVKSMLSENLGGILGGNQC